jgi:hypothetical protein
LLHDTARTPDLGKRKEDKPTKFQSKTKEKKRKGGCLVVYSWALSHQHILETGEDHFTMGYFYFDNFHSRHLNKLKNLKNTENFINVFYL